LRSKTKSNIFQWSHPQTYSTNIAYSGYLTSKQKGLIDTTLTTKLIAKLYSYTLKGKNN